MNRRTTRRIMYVIGVAAFVVLAARLAPEKDSIAFAGKQVEPQSARVTLTDKQKLGKMLYFDKTLSAPNGQSCATCHSPSAGFADPDDSSPVSNGVIEKRVGFRNTPTAAYASFIPPLSYNADDETYVGGLFLDGRAATLSDQAEQPFLNTLEMHNPDKDHVVNAVRRASYSSKFKQVFGNDALDANKTETAYSQIADAIANFESSPVFSPFTSKYDYYLKGKAKLTAREALGLDLFNNKAGCAACHPSTATDGQPGPMFTDFTYDNIGIPKNWKNPFLNLPRKLNRDGIDFIDIGLAKTVATFDPLNAHLEAGKFRVTTLRNIELTAPYGHNGFFKSLREVVNFYNTRDVPAANWAPAEVPETENKDELGNLGLTEREVDAIVAFLKTLTDGYDPRK